MICFVSGRVARVTNVGFEHQPNHQRSSSHAFSTSLSIGELPVCAVLWPLVCPLPVTPRDTSATETTFTSRTFLAEDERNANRRQ